MAEYLDVTKWARRDLFQFFINFDNPYFNICTRVDVSRLLELLRGRPDVSVTLAYHYFALRVANEIEPFRYRLREGKVLVHDVINGGTTVLLPNESFGFAYFDYHENFEKFITKAQQAVSEVQKGDGPFTPNCALENSSPTGTKENVTFSMRHAELRLPESLYGGSLWDS